MSNTFNLINALTPFEKRKISFYLKVHNHNKVQLSLFKILAKQIDYNKNKAEQQLKKKAKYNSRYEVLEYALQQSILKYLRIVSRKKKVKFQLSEIVDVVEILLDKGLYTLCLNKIKEGVKMAQEIDSNNFLYQLHGLERKVKRLNKTDLPEAKMHQKITQHLTNLIENETYIYYDQKIYELCLEVFFLNKKSNLEELTKIINLPIFKTAPKSVISRNNYYKSLVIYYAVIHDDKKAFDYEMKNLAQMKQYPKLKEEDLSEYTLVLGSLHSKALSLNKIVLVEELLMEIKDIKRELEGKLVDRTNYKIMFLYYNSLVRKMNYTTTTADLPEDELNKFFLKNKKFVSEVQLISICHEVSYNYLMKGDYKKAHEWTSKLYQDDNKFDSHYSYVTAILNYLIHFELGNYELLEKIRMEIVNQLKKLKTKSLFDTLLQDLFSSEFKIPKVLANQSLLDTYITKMNSSIKGTPQEKLLNDVNIIAWLISKRDNVKFIEALRSYKN